MRTRMALAAGFIAAASLLAACGDAGTAPRPVISPFDSIAQANVSGALKLFGGGGQWTLDLTVVVHNTTSVRRVFTVHPDCPVLLFVYTNFAGTGTDVWNTAGQHPGCKSATATDTIAPGDSLVLRAPQTNTNEILAHYGVPPANPPGQYFFYWSLPTALAPSGEVRGLAGFSQLGP